MNVKRAFDIAASASGLIVLSPLFAAASVVGALHFKKSPFFLVDRIGKDQTPFKMLKFRSMTDEKDADGTLLPDEQRRTKYGRFLRISSIDELPQLVNILKGDMSFIGPRPNDERFAKTAIAKGYNDIFSVRPGLTGIWQVNAIGLKHKMSKRERFELEAENVRRTISFKDNAMIVVKSLKSFYSGHDGEYFGKKRDEKQTDQPLPPNIILPH